VRTFLVVIGHPIGQLLACVGERREQRLVEQLVTKSAVKTLDKAFCCGLPGATQCHSTCASCDQRRMALLVNSVPLSDTHIAGRPRPAIKVSSSRATRRPGSEPEPMRYSNDGPTDPYAMVKISIGAFRFLKGKIGPIDEIGTLFFGGLSRVAGVGQ
jgi:hypothetical protein